MYTYDIVLSTCVFILFSGPCSNIIYLKTDIVVIIFKNQLNALHCAKQLPCFISYVFINPKTKR